MDPSQGARNGRYGMSFLRELAQHGVLPWMMGSDFAIAEMSTAPPELGPPGRARRDRVHRRSGVGYTAGGGR